MDYALWLLFILEIYDNYKLRKKVIELENKLWLANLK